MMKVYIKDDSKKYFGMSGYNLAVYIMPLPLLGAVACVMLSILNNFEGSTATHCRVRNYLPSISAAIGGYTPQRYIWRMCIALHSSPRIMIAIMLYNYNKSLIPKSNQVLFVMTVKLALVLHLIELASLLILSNISSTENYSIHEGSFITFLTCSLIYMFLTCIIMKWGHSFTGMSYKVATCYWYEKLFFGANLTALAFAVYFFYRHNAYCEPGVYSLFALCEYALVTANILFHASTLLTLWHRVQVIIYLPSSEVNKYMYQHPV